MAGTLVSVTLGCGPGGGGGGGQGGAAGHGAGGGAGSGGLAGMGAAGGRGGTGGKAGAGGLAGSGGMGGSAAGNGGMGGGAAGNGGMGGGAAGSGASGGAGAAGGGGAGGAPGGQSGGGAGGTAGAGGQGGGGTGGGGAGSGGQSGGGTGGGGAAGSGGQAGTGGASGSAGNSAGTSGGAGGAAGGSGGRACIGDVSIDFASIGDYFVDMSASCVATSVGDGALQLTGNASCRSDAGFVQLDTNRFQICGDFDVRVDFALTTFPIPSTGGRWAGVRAFQSGTSNGVTIERYDLFMTNTCVLALENYKGWTTNSNDCSSQIMSGGDATGTFRLTREGSMVTAYFLASGSSDDWVQIATGTSTTVPWILKLYTSYDGSDAGSETVRFSNMRITSATAP